MRTMEKRYKKPRERRMENRGVKKKEIQIDTQQALDIATTALISGVSGALASRAIDQVWK